MQLHPIWKSKKYFNKNIYKDPSVLLLYSCETWRVM